VATKEAYGRVRLSFSDSRTLDCDHVTSRLYNRFEDLVFPDHPELPRLKQELLVAGASAALMSGSGSAVYGLAGSREQGAQILAQIQKTYNQSWLVHTV
jgi:4-diphosphocytidyl-2-C-methyl-D-erythritol kinase